MFEKSKGEENEEILQWRNKMPTCDHGSISGGSSDLRLLQKACKSRL